MIQRARAFYREHIRDLLAEYWLPLLACGVAIGLLFHYVDPAPPRHLEIGTGSDDGAFSLYAERYKQILAKDKIDLVIRASSGSQQNLAWLANEQKTIEVGFLQGGLPNIGDATNLQSLGSMYYEPFWVFVRTPANGGAPVPTRFNQLKGMKIATGVIGGGTRPFATRLFALSGVTQANTTFVPLSGQAAADALVKGEIDAAAFLTTLESSFIVKLLTTPGVTLISLDQAEALVRNFSYLHRVTLPRGVVDIEANIPPEDIQMVASTVTLAARDDIHPALATLLLKAATQVHGQAGLMQKEREFPSDRDTDLPLSPSAERYYKNGPPFLQTYLPFWLAVWVDRMFLVLLPILAVLIPVVKLAPVVYSWRVRSKVYHWYGELKYLEGQLRGVPDEDTETPDTRPTAERLPGLLERLDWIEEQVNHIRLPLAFSNHAYFLREHIELVRNAIMRVPKAMEEPRDEAVGAAGHGPTG